jgi:hypothetical protein
MRRRLEAEHVGIADVQIAHARAGGLDTLGFHHDVADGIAERVDPVGDGHRRTLGDFGNGHAATIQRIML